MKTTTYIIAVSGLGLLCAGCESDLDYKGDIPPAKMVLNAMVDCGEHSHAVKVSESVFAFSDQKPAPVADPNLALKINGAPVDITYDRSVKEHNYYRFDASLQPGDKIGISGYTPTHGHVEGTDIVPNPPQILAVTPEWFAGAENEMSFLRTRIKIKDRPDEDNYYRIVIHTKTIFIENNPDEINWQTSEIYLDQEILFKNITGTLGEDDTNLFAIFSDELFRGQEYTLNVYIRKDNFSAWDAKQYVKVEIQSLSENLYRYLRSVELACSGDNFTEPVKIFSNINGGFGILGAYTTGQMTIEVE